METDMLYKKSWGGAPVCQNPDDPDVLSFVFYYLCANSLLSAVINLSRSNTKNARCEGVDVCSETTDTAQEALQDIYSSIWSTIHPVWAPHTSSLGPSQTSTGWNQQTLLAPPQQEKLVIYIKF